MSMSSGAQTISREKWLDLGYPLWHGKWWPWVCGKVRKKKKEEIRRNKQNNIRNEEGEVAMKAWSEHDGREREERKKKVR